MGVSSGSVEDGCLAMGGLALLPEERGTCRHVAKGKTGCFYELLHNLHSQAERCVQCILGPSVGFKATAPRPVVNKKTCTALRQEPDAFSWFGIYGSSVSGVKTRLRTESPFSRPNSGMCRQLGINKR